MERRLIKSLSYSKDEKHNDGDEEDDNDDDGGDNEGIRDQECSGHCILI